MYEFALWEMWTLVKALWLVFLLKVFWIMEEAVQEKKCSIIRMRQKLEEPRLLLKK